MPMQDGYQTSIKIKQLILTGLYKTLKIIAYTSLEGEEEE